MKRHLNRTVFVYAGLALFAFIFDKIYSLFSHGVHSDAMTYMFLWILLFGVCFFGLLRLLLRSVAAQKGYRWFYNIYNTAVGVFIAGKMLQGILEIAGGTSGYLPFYYYTSYLLFAVAAGFFVASLVQLCRNQKLR